MYKSITTIHCRVNNVYMLTILFLSKSGKKRVFLQDDQSGIIFTQKHNISYFHCRPNSLAGKKHSFSDTHFFFTAFFEPHITEWCG